MKLLCTKCGICWASLHTQTYSLFDEEYEACPQCGNDTHLETINDDRDTFTMDYFSHHICNTRTGEVFLVVRKTPPPPPVDPPNAAMLAAEYNYQQSLKNRYE